MAQIHLLSPETINRIAAGEVIDRPSGVVKELAENAIDAGASAITVEIRNGGLDLIRVTDNGCGIEGSQVPAAFRRHATSKIEDAEDLNRLCSLGFRGEALSSIAAVSEVEMITCTRGALIGTRAVLIPETLQSGDGVPDENRVHSDGTEEAPIPMEITQIGAPEGTTVIVRNLFRNVPVRRRFLKSPNTEAGYISDLISSLALSHPDISFHYRRDGQEKLHTTGNGDIRELIYRIYGRETLRAVIPFEYTRPEEGISISGWLGRPELSRSTRGFEFFFVNGRILKSDVLSGGLEDGYRTDLMQHRFPFAMIWLTIPAGEIDVNVHPSKMEVRFTDARRIYSLLSESVHAALHGEELIPRETPDTRTEEAAAERDRVRMTEEQQSRQPHLEPFERNLPRDSAPDPGSASVPGSAPDSPFSPSVSAAAPEGNVLRESETAYAAPAAARFEEDGFTFIDKTAHCEQTVRYEQERLFRETELPDRKTAEAREAQRLSSLQKEEERLPDPFDPVSDAAANLSSLCDEDRVLTKETVRSFRWIGQLFGTYWLIEVQDKLLMIDQHAAHEKVNFERLMRRLQKEQQEPAPSQMLSPPIIVHLTGREEAAYLQYEEYFRRMGYEIEPFGENAHAIRSVPLELYANEPDELLRRTLDELSESRIGGTPSAILYKIASMSCKASIKGNTVILQSEAEDLIDELLRCDNPYHCPHGRPTMIVMPKSEIDRKFKRIIS